MQRRRWWRRRVETTNYVNWCHSRESGKPFSVPEKYYYVYVLANKPRGTTYIGVTSNLVRRVWQHKEDQVEGFTKRYGIKMLVWFEQHEDVEQAILREKQIKKWDRLWKVELIESNNPEWNDLYETIIG
jgi:putative endonuclease